MFVLGKMKLDYKLMMKIIHYNIAPTRSEKKLKLADVVFFYIMINFIVLDVAECIWNEMVAFKKKSPPRSIMPFVAMVSQLCKSARVLVMIGDGLLQPPIGTITMAYVKKSTAMSRILLNPLQKVLTFPQLPQQLLRKRKSHGKPLVNVKTIGYKWVYEKQRGPDGSIETFKSRLVAKRFTQKKELIMRKYFHRRFA